jgi:hypothetical protein
MRGVLLPMKIYHRGHRETEDTENLFSIEVGQLQILISKVRTTVRQKEY